MLPAGLEGLLVGLWLLFQYPIPFQHVLSPDAPAEATLLSHPDPEPWKAAAAWPLPAPALLNGVSAQGPQRPQHWHGRGLGWEVHLPRGAHGEQGTGGGEGVHLGTRALANPVLSPTASLCALQSPLQAIGGLASDLGNELLTGPLLHQFPWELTQVRPGCPGWGRSRGRGGSGPSPLGSGFFHPGCSCWSRLLGVWPWLSSPPAMGLARGRASWSNLSRGRSSCEYLAGRPGPAREGRSLRGQLGSWRSPGAGNAPLDFMGVSPAGGVPRSWPRTGPTAPCISPVSSALTPRPAASTCRACSWWSTTMPPSTCGPTCTGAGLTLGLGAGVTWRGTTVPSDPWGAGGQHSAAVVLGFRVGRTARAGKSGQAFTLLLKVQVSPRGLSRRPGLSSTRGTRGGAGWAEMNLFPSCASLQERRFLRMLEEGGVPGLERHDTPSELLQPLVPRYEEALSLLEKAIKVRGCPRGLISGGNPRWREETGWGSPRPGSFWAGVGHLSLGGAGLAQGVRGGDVGQPCLPSCRRSGSRRQPRPGLGTPARAPSFLERSWAVAARCLSRRQGFLSDKSLGPQVLCCLRPGPGTHMRLGPGPRPAEGHKVRSASRQVVFLETRLQWSCSHYPELTGPGSLTLGAKHWPLGRHCLRGIAETRGHAVWSSVLYFMIIRVRWTSRKWLRGTNHWLWASFLRLMC